MPSEFEIIELDPDYALGTFRDVFVLIWRRETTMKGANALREQCSKFGKQRMHGIALLTIIEERAPMPPSDARESIAGFLRDASDYIQASGVVFEGTGFRAAAVRSVVVSLTMLARQQYPHKVFATLEETALWLEREAGASLEQPFSAHELESSIKSMRARIGQSASVA